MTQSRKRQGAAKKKRFMLSCLFAAVIVVVLAAAAALNLHPFKVLTNNNPDTSSLVMTVYPVNAIKGRVFSAPANTSNLCIPQGELMMERDKNAPSNEGLLLVRIPKTGSSTVGGVAARIAYSMARKYNNNKFVCCKSRLTHAWSTHYLRRQGNFANRNHSTSFLWTILRDPAQRALSGYYFFEVNKNDGNVKNAVSVLSKRSNHMLKWVGSKNATPHGIEEVIQEFDFMGLLERLDESLVILQLLLGLQPFDVLYLKAKTSGTFDISNKCRRTPKVVETLQITEYLSSDEWFQHNHGDYMLYSAVNQSLDLTIKAIGRTKFLVALNRFREIKAIADDYCEYKSPCIGEGEYRPRNEVGSKCYVEDWGCGYECLDELFHMNETA